ncbi:lytic transglycosylase domain-containing protein [Mesorhizobium sp. GR13]|uniref:lytic transglycosylase domain-containing protein n=1 Tax=Mesorhizobium sp. GR13 TaxID=2562308 RepID=UPI0010BF7F85|nr:lytic transglycosylase domain-containing protein [Mesorhizobium sp. GR13]
MATQATSPSIRPLLAVTLLASIYAIVPSETEASDLYEGKGQHRPIAADSRASNEILSSAGTIAEARWARSQDAYVLGEGGHIVPHASAAAVIATPNANAYRGDDQSNHFSIGTEVGVPECGPSPATPAEITRLVAEAAKQHKVDVGFAVAVVTAESRLDRLRNSPKGARGPMQLMPDTAERYGVTDICDPEENIDGGVRYLRELTDEFRNPLLVAAAYNAGEGRVREYGGIPPLKETVGYVAEVLNIQMGLEGSGPSPREQHSKLEDTQLPSSVSGVITSRERRQWVGGVMHF